MRHFLTRRILCAVFVCCFLVTVTVYADTTQQQIDKARDEITDLQQQKEDAENQVDSLNDEKEGLEQDLSGLNGELGTITAAMNQVEADIAAKEQEIAEAEEELAAAEAKSAEQYEAMKLRIQYMYENGNTTAFAMLLESKSIADFLNRTEYISELNQYDRQMLTDFQELTAQIAEQKEALEGEREELLALQEQKQTEQENVNRLIADTQGNQRDGYIIGDMTVSPERITITGAESQVEQISRAVALIQISGISKDTDIEAELKLYSPSVTDFMIVVKRKYVGVPQKFNAVLVSDWTEQLTHCALIISEDDGGTKTSWKCSAVVKIKSKSYGFDIDLPINTRDDIVWRGSLSRRFIETYDGTPSRFGDVNLTFEIVGPPETSD